jgi:hypothetical protein
VTSDRKGRKKARISFTNNSRSSIAAKCPPWVMCVQRAQYLREAAVLVVQSAQLSSLRNPGTFVASAHIGVVSAQRQSQGAVLNSRRLRRYVTVRSMPKRVLARGALLVCANTTVISQTAAKPAINMTPIDDGFDERAGAAIFKKGVLLWPSPLASSRRRGVAACGGSLAALRSPERPLNRMTVLGLAA